MQLEQIKEILDKNSDRMLTRVTAMEAIEIKAAISAFVSEIEGSDLKIKQNLLDFKFGQTHSSVLHLAAKFGDSIQLEKILKIALKIDPNYRDIRNDNAYTPLHYAAQNGNIALVRALLAAGADKNPAASASYRRWVPAHYAAQFGHLEVLKTLMEAGVNKEVKTSFNLTPLMIGSEFGNIAIVEYMLSIGAEKNVQTTEDNHKMTALHYAAVKNFKDVALALLKAGIDKYKETTFGLTALEFAAKSNHDEMVGILLAWGANKMDAALKIAEENESANTIVMIKKYQKIRNNFFTASWVEEKASDLVHKIKEYNRENLNEMKLIFPDGVNLNAYGILNLNKEVGFFKKVSKSLIEFLEESGVDNLRDALNGLKKLTGSKGLS
jgi:ankyrin repeat protein